MGAGRLRSIALQKAPAESGLPTLQGAVIVRRRKKVLEVQLNS